MTRRKRPFGSTMECIGRHKTRKSAAADDLVNGLRPLIHLHIAAAGQGADGTAETCRAIKLGS
jgi:hypothetical protein